MTIATLFEKFGLIHRVFAFIKDEGNNLALMATNCVPLLIVIC
jgi:hypothetical protein